MDCLAALEVGPGFLRRVERLHTGTGAGGGELLTKTRRRQRDLGDLMVYVIIYKYWRIR